MRIILLVFLYFVMTVFAYPATRIWDGGGADTNWQTAANWSPDGAPATGDDLIFPAAALQQTNNNNFFILTSFNSITVEGGTYTFGGNPIRLVNGMNINGGSATFNLALTLSVGQTFTAATGATATIVILSVSSAGLTIDGAGTVGIGLISGSGSVTKNGTGIGAIIAASGFSGQITLRDGIFVVDANIPNSPVDIQGNAQVGTLGLSGFGGTGTVGATTVASGVISAGTLTSPTGILNIAGGLGFTTNGTYACKIAGTSPGSNGHDQLNVTGSVNLNHARLAPIPWNGFSPAIGDTYVIIKNDAADAVNGTFLNAPEGATFAGPLNTAYQITYHGGDGNDVAITRVRHSTFDFDGDGKADVSVYRPSTGVWYELLSANNGFYTTAFGFSTDKIVPADYDGDNRTDIAVYRPSNGTWYMFRSSDQTYTGVQFGIAEDIPVPNDFDGDGKADVAVFRPSTGIWYEYRSLGNQFYATQFGQNGDLPQMGDFDGDGIGDITVFRGGIWYFYLSGTNTYTATQWGLATDKPVPADYDGDGKTDVAVYRGGVWYISQSSGGFTGFQFGIASDKPIAADYDGDGKTDAAVYRDGVWYLLRSTAGYGGVTFGLPTDAAIPAAY